MDILKIRNNDTAAAEVADYTAALFQPGIIGPNDTVTVRVQYAATVEHPDGAFDTLTVYRDGRIEAQ